MTEYIVPLTAKAEFQDDIDYPVFYYEFASTLDPLSQRFGGRPYNSEQDEYPQDEVISYWIFNDPDNAENFSRRAKNELRRSRVKGLRITPPESQDFESDISVYRRGQR